VTPTTADETAFARLAELTRQLQATTKRLEKRALLAAFLHSLRRDEVAPAVHLIVGRIFAESDARSLNVGWATLKKALGRTKQASLVREPSASWRCRSRSRRSRKPTAPTRRGCVDGSSRVSWDGRPKTSGTCS